MKLSIEFKKGVLAAVLRRKRFIINAGLYFSAIVIGMLTNLTLHPFLALYLEHEDYAIIGYYASFGGLFNPLISFLFIRYYTRNYFSFTSEERGKAKNTLLISLMTFSLLMALFSMAGLYVYYLLQGVSLPFFPFALLSLSATLLNCFYLFLLADLKMERNARRYFKIFVSHALIQAIASILFVIILQWGALGKMLATALVALIFAFFVLKNSLKGWKFEAKYFRGAVSFSWPLVLAGMLTYFFTGVDRALLERTGDIELLGLYNIAFSITGYLVVFNTALSDTFKPDIFESVAKNNKKKLVKIASTETAVNLFIVGIFIIFAPLIIRILTFGRFTDAADFARILCLKNVTSGLYYTMSSVIIAYGFSRITLYNKILGAVLSLIMFNYMIKNFGFYGAAWGQVLAFLAMSVISFVFIVYKIKVKQWSLKASEHSHNN